jgi:hypothetical protein
VCVRLSVAFWAIYQTVFHWDENKFPLMRGLRRIVDFDTCAHVRDQCWEVLRCG